MVNKLAEEAEWTSIGLVQMPNLFDNNSFASQRKMLQAKKLIKLGSKEEILEGGMKRKI